MTLPLNTTPGPSPDEESARSIEIARHLLRQAGEELDRQDLLQASEKAWGAAAHAVKAVAEKRRWFNDADWKLARIATVIATEQGDRDISAYYRSVREAHYNFYHHELNWLQVQEVINDAASLIGKLEEVLDNSDVPARHVSVALDQEIRRLEQPTSALDRQRLQQGRPPMDRRPPVEPESADIED